MLDRLREQHSEILALARTLADLARLIPTAGHGLRLRAALDRWAALLGEHLALEDQRLYPQLLASADPLVSSSARRFSAEMGGLASAFAVFDERWRDASAIEREAASFRGDLDSVTEALTQRILAEENLLYLLQGRAGARAG
ncbi:MAG: hemerythrin domain-containing protein [Planctomycetes bacterium]|nr:hemerythrin domain-containing protein [Planctomycetota bacterium]